jgi:hypothetical protein
LLHLSVRGRNLNDSMTSESNLEGLTGVAKGAWAELSALQWLVERGYWVAQGATTHAPFDVVAVAPDGEIFLFDVKFINKDSRQKNRFRTRSPLQVALKIRLLYVIEDNPTRHVVEPPLDSCLSPEGE